MFVLLQHTHRHTALISKLSIAELLSHFLRKCFLTLDSAWKMARGMARSVTGAPSGFLEITKRQESPASFTIWSPRNCERREGGEERGRRGGREERRGGGEEREREKEGGRKGGREERREGEKERGRKGEREKRRKGGEERGRRGMKVRK